MISGHTRDCTPLKSELKIPNESDFMEHLRLIIEEWLINHNFPSAPIKSHLFRYVLQETRNWERAEFFILLGNSDICTY
jgi:hypothetical protein